MLFLPLGLYTKIFRIPWVTILLVLINLFISFQTFEAVDTAEKQFLRSDKKLVVLQKKMAMIGFLCEKKDIFHKQVCSQLKAVSQTKPTSLMQPLNDLKSLIKPISVFKKDEAKLQEFIFNDDLKDEDLLILNGTREHDEWMQATTEFDLHFNQVLKQQGLLSRGNWNFFSAMKAQFVHAGYMHLFGNLIFFIFLSIFVELRVGAFLYLMLYLLTGIAGLSAQLLIMSSDSTPLMGASASIAGIAGAFTVFFWRKKLKVLATISFVYNRIIPLPVYFFFPILIFSSDLAGALNPLQTNVAHVAHLGGFVLGAFLAYLVMKADNLPSSFSFMNEFLEFHRLLKSKEANQLKAWTPLLEINPENNLIHQHVLTSCEPFGEWSTLTAEQKSYVTSYLPIYLSNESKNLVNFFAILNRFPESWPLKPIFQPISSRDLRKLLQVSEQQDVKATLVLMDVLFERYPKLKRDSTWLEQQENFRQKLNEQKGQSRGLTA